MNGDPIRGLSTPLLDTRQFRSDVALHRDVRGCFTTVVTMVTTCICVFYLCLPACLSEVNLWVAFAPTVRRSKNLTTCPYIYGVFLELRAACIF